MWSSECLRRSSHGRISTNTAPAWPACVSRYAETAHSSVDDDHVDSCSNCVFDGCAATDAAAADLAVKNSVTTRILANSLARLL